MGTVQATCLPARKAARLCGAWSWIGELMWTASISGSRITSSKLVYRLAIPQRGPASSRSVFDRRQIATTSAPG
jgi:hypothetical protein